MAEAESEDVIKEGFICPICHKDMRSPKNLLAHFQDLHSEEQDILKSLKDLVGKAKKKLLKLDDQELEWYKSDSDQKYYLEPSEPQKPGHCRVHTDYFKAIRRERLDHSTTETNKLIIRLDRLLRVYGSDRKQHEQELVAWIDGAVVSRCPSCAASFNITRRQHHCRLCGSIMCNSCSYFLSYDIAQTIVAPVYNRDVNSRDNSSTKSENESLRICGHCMGMLECRRQAQIAQMVQPIICQLYSHLQNIKIQIQSSIDLYQKMYKSLTIGDTTYQLHEAQSLHAYLAKQAESLDTISKKIATLPTESESPQTADLQNSIRRATSHYIKEYLVTLPVLPTLAELEKLKQERLLKYSELPHDVPNTNVKVKKVAVTTGWSPANVITDNVNEAAEDPLQEQIRIVKNYIEQAKLAQRNEEVDSLCDNLRMLQEMQRQKQREQRRDNTRE